MLHPHIYDIYVNIYVWMYICTNICMYEWMYMRSTYIWNMHAIYIYIYAQNSFSSNIGFITMNIFCSQPCHMVILVSHFIRVQSLKSDMICPTHYFPGMIVAWGYRKSHSVTSLRAGDFIIYCNQLVRQDWVHFSAVNGRPIKKLARLRVSGCARVGECESVFAFMLVCSCVRTYHCAFLSPHFYIMNLYNYDSQMMQFFQSYWSPSQGLQIFTVSSTNSLV